MRYLFRVFAGRRVGLAYYHRECLPPRRDGVLIVSSSIKPGSSPGQDSPVRRVPAPRLDGRVLVVDDTEARRYLIAQSLRLAGMEVLEAATGQGALAAARSRRTGAALPGSGEP